MSIATAAGAKALFGDMMSPQQKIAANMPASAAAVKFANYLTDEQPIKAASASKSGLAPSPEQLAKNLFGDVYDPTAGSIRVDKAAAAAERHSAEFTQLLRLQLAGIGIDPKQPVELSIGAEGRVIVDGSHPHAAEITRLFEENPALAQAYRDVAARNDRFAILQAGAAYVKDWQTAANDGERQAAWQRSSALMERLSSLFSGRMTFGAGSAVAESQQVLRRMGFA